MAKQLKKTIKIFLPSNLNDGELLRLFGAARGAERLIQGTRLLYSYLIKGGFNMDSSNGFGSEYKQVHSDFLRAFFGNSYASVVNKLVSWDYLERLESNDNTGEYMAGGIWRHPSKGDKEAIAKQYRIPARLLGEESKFRVAPESTTRIMRRKLASINKRVTGLHESNREYVREMMQQIVLVDSSESRAVLARLADEKRIRAAPDAFLTLFNTSPFNETVVDSFGYRVHSQVVMSPKVLRPFMRFRDALDVPLIELDLVNAQPALLACLTPALIKRFVPECRSVIPLLKAAQREEDYLDFQRLCFNGTLYEFLRDRFNEVYGEHLVKPITRNDAKEIFYVAAFGDYEYLEGLTLEALQHEVNLSILFQESETVLEQAQAKLHSLRAYSLFKSEFKAVWQFYRAVKQLKWDFNPGKRHSNNCLLAQRMESHLIFSILVQALRDSGIIYMATIHDAIFLRNNDEEKARKVVQENFSKLRIKLKLKPVETGRKYLLQADGD